MNAHGRGTVRFGGFELDPATGELWRDDEPVDLPPQPARLLALLARSPGRIVTRDQIQEEVWGDTVVEFDQAINNAVRQLRSVLGDDASAPRFIETVPRRGYRFIAPIEEILPEGGSEDAGDGEEVRGGVGSPGRPPGASRVSGWGPGRLLGLAAVIVTIGAAAWFGVDRGVSDRGTILAVVPSRATIVGSPAEAVADTLTPLLIDALSALDVRDLQVIPWTWDMGLDPETGRARRDGEEVDVDVILEANVYEEADGFEISLTLTRLPEGIQIWYRRVEELQGEPADVASQIVPIMTDAVRERIGGAATER